MIYALSRYWNYFQFKSHSISSVNEVDFQTMMCVIDAKWENISGLLDFAINFFMNSRKVYDDITL